jgi:hypothetical protein
MKLSYESWYVEIFSKRYTVRSVYSSSLVMLTILGCGLAAAGIGGRRRGEVAGLRGPAESPFSSSPATAIMSHRFLKL